MLEKYNFFTGFSTNHKAQGALVVGALAGAGIMYLIMNR